MFMKWMSLFCLVPLTACLDQLEPQSSVKGNFISHSLLSSMLNCNFLHCLVLKLKHHPAASFFKDDSLSAFILFTLMLCPALHLAFAARSLQNHQLHYCISLSGVISRRCCTSRFAKPPKDYLTKPNCYRCNKQSSLIHSLVCPD